MGGSSRHSSGSHVITFRARVGGEGKGGGLTLKIKIDLPHRTFCQSQTQEKKIDDDRYFSVLRTIKNIRIFL